MKRYWLTALLSLMVVPAAVMHAQITSCPQISGTSGCQTVTIGGASYLTPLYPVPLPPPSVLPTPPATAVVFSDLQKATGWTQCAGPSCAGGSSGGSGSLTQGIATPSLSGSSMKQTSTGAGYDVMYYNHLTCAKLPSGSCANVSNFLLDFYLYIDPSSTHIQALEFDPQQYVGGYKISMSMQCEDVNKLWRWWNQSAGGWTTSTYPCTLATQLGTWHHFQIYITTNPTAHTYEFQTLVLDGTTVFENIAKAFTATNKGYSDNIGVQEQIDNNSSAGTNTVYYDQYQLTVW